MQKSFSFVSNGSLTQDDSISELPEIPALKHLAKARPKRPKKHAASRTVLKVTIISQKFVGLVLIYWMVG